MNEETIIIPAVIGFGAFLVGLGIGSLPAFWFNKRIRYRDHLIHIKNNPLGWETILVDGSKIISKFTFLGTHRFLVENDNFEVKIRYRWHLLAVRVRCTVNEEMYYEE
jgi:hypothetical protein